ncbi:Peptidoglycan-binding lysin domain [Macleaya cordata]|uniref:Peptidoglycan-binding lysin domain n=1 Tax=Macleaya cordata TaxID=56857 RepID=A0A200QBY5_MACCD|nr:Peptidoglycan-binding lysin domain [Macleaya cordata]
MAKVISNKAAAMFFNFFLILSLLLILSSSMAEAGRLFGVGFGKPKSTLKCDSVFGARSGDTCFGITQMFNLTSEVFTEFNPNLVCDNLFVGQWICVAGTTN